MVYDKIIEGKFVKLRSITPEDAEFSYNLRKDPRFVEIMGQPAKTVEDQKKFIEWQIIQPGDYYFVVLNKKNEKIGLLGVYNIQNGIGETGREINIGAPNETIEAQLLLTDFCVDILHLKTRTCVIYKKNIKQLNLLKKFKLFPKREVVRSGIASFEFEDSFEDILQVQKKARTLISEMSI